MAIIKYILYIQYNVLCDNCHIVATVSLHNFLREATVQCGNPAQTQKHQLHKESWLYYKLFADYCNMNTAYLGLQVK